MRTPELILRRLVYILSRSIPVGHLWFGSDAWPEADQPAPPISGPAYRAAPRPPRREPTPLRFVVARLAFALMFACSVMEALRDVQEHHGLVPTGTLAAIGVGCAAGQHSHPWTTDAGAALSACAHALDTADAIVAQRYTAESQVAGANLDALDLRFAPFSTTRRIAREALIAAEAALDTAVTVHDARSRCDAVAAIRTATDALRHVAGALAAGGITEAPGIAETVSALVNVAALGPACGGAP
jgi:hypothetical protein